MVIRFFIPATTANDLRLRRIFYPRLYPLHLFSYLNFWERASISPFECSVLNKGTTGTIFITSLVWRSPWLGIEPGTSRTRSQHYTTRLSRRLLYWPETLLSINFWFWDYTVWVSHWMVSKVGSLSYWSGLELSHTSWLSYIYVLVLNTTKSLCFYKLKITKEWLTWRQNAQF